MYVCMYVCIRVCVCLCLCVQRLRSKIGMYGYNYSDLHMPSDIFTFT